MDLRDLWRPGSALTWRRLRVLINGLPQHSATHTALRDSMSPQQLAASSAERERDGRHGRWSHEAMLLAQIVDALNFLRAEQVALRGGKPRDPSPVYRPGIDPPKPKRLSPEQATFLERLRQSRKAVT